MCNVNSKYIYIELGTIIYIKNRSLTTTYNIHNVKSVGHVVHNIYFPRFFFTLGLELQIS